MREFKYFLAPVWQMFLGVISWSISFSISTQTIAGSAPSALVAGAGLLLVGGGLLLLAWRCWVFGKWQSGDLDTDDICYGCGGILGRVRDGRYGPYRQCWMCGKNDRQ